MEVKVLVADPGKGWCPDRIDALLTGINLEEIDLLLFPQDIFYGRPWTELAKTAELKEINSEIISKFSELAVKNKLYLSPGTIVEVDGDKYYRTAILFNHQGEIILKQKQLFLTGSEQRGKMARGREVVVIKTELGRLGFMIGTDCWYPEVGRFLALEGVDVVLAPVDLSEKNEWNQLSGVWQQVQQNQFYALEAAGDGRSLVHGPSEITPYRTGLLAPVANQVDLSNLRPDDYLKLLQNIQQTGLAEYKTDIIIEPGDECKTPVSRQFLLQAGLNLEELKQLRSDYPLLSILNPAFYQLNPLDRVKQEVDK